MSRTLWSSLFAMWAYPYSCTDCTTWHWVTGWFSVIDNIWLVVDTEKTSDGDDLAKQKTVVLLTTWLFQGQKCDAQTEVRDLVHWYGHPAGTEHNHKVNELLTSACQSMLWSWATNKNSAATNTHLFVLITPHLLCVSFFDSSLIMSCFGSPLDVISQKCRKSS